MDERLEQEIIELHSGICSALADPKRIMILYTLADGPRNVTELSEELGLPQPTTSRHLKVLRERDLVNTERSGTSVIYTLADPKLLRALDLLRDVLRGIYIRRASVIENRDSA
jgi:DNA-binding transcriptional ArsR family regulator